MSFSSLLEKIANNETLSAAEKQELVLEARRAEQAVSLLNSIIKPGSATIKIENLEASNVNIDNGDIVLDNNSISIDLGGGFIVIDSEGITLDNDVGLIRFKNAAGEVKMGMYAKFNDALIISQDTAGKEIIISNKLTSGSFADIHLVEDPAQVNRVQFNIGAGEQGAALTLTNEMWVRAAGGSGGANFVKLGGSPATPPTPDALASGGVAGHLYVKGGKLICQYEDAGTVRYKYLDLTGTGVTWVHTTTAP